MRKSLTISAVVHAMVLLWSLIAFAPKAFEKPIDSVPVDIISASDFSRMVAGSRNAPKAPTPKPVVDKVGETKLTDNSAPKVVDKPEIVKTAEKEAPPEAKPEPKMEAPNLQNLVSQPHEEFLFIAALLEAGKCRLEAEICYHLGAS